MIIHRVITVLLQTKFTVYCLENTFLIVNFGSGNPKSSSKNYLEVNFNTLLISILNGVYPKN